MKSKNQTIFALKTKRYSRVSSIITRGLFLSFLGGILVACPAPNQNLQGQKSPQPTPKTVLEERLILKNATLEHANAKGEILWKINVERTVYSQNNKQADLEGLSGDLFQDGEVVMKIKAKKGKIEENGEKVFLRENIVAIDPRNGTILRGEELDWLPQKDLVLMRNNFTGSHPELEMSAQEGSYLTRQQRIEAHGKVIGTAVKSPVQFRTERVVWEVKNKKIISPGALQMDRYQGRTVTDRIIADQGEMNLTTQIVTLRNNIEMNSLNPRVQLATNSASWNVQKRTVVSKSPLRIIHHDEQVTVTANEGFFDFQKQVARVEGGSRSLSVKQQADLYADRIVWQIPQKRIKANGNVIYQQVSPPLQLVGTEAIGRLDEHKIIVTKGNSSQQVVSEIVPNKK